MMSRALEICARSLFKHVSLSCDGDNTPAIALYKELGFTKIGEIVSYYPRSG
jgi:ribosomal protein S18 acetylase RimI-like enzyme